MKNIPFLSKWLPILLFLSIVGSGFSQSPDITIKDFQLLEDGTGIVRISTLLRNEASQPLSFTYHSTAGKAFSQQSGFITRIYLDGYEGPTQNSTQVSIDIPRGDFLAVDFLYKVDPDQNYSILLENGQVLPFNQFLNYLLHELTTSDGFSRMLAEAEAGCSHPTDPEMDFTFKTLESLRSKIDRLHSNLKELKAQMNWKFI